ncbi:MAG: YedE-related selenium metabolism membrane protein [Firmicutes bacterium]|jgi:YedE family putative selenium metabolism protein|nr:YedE-related selenium metabolism membrane protein [Bacillota bacterium]MBU4532942.1 YedE-related selenium metabolism membrane protein [Bacillota bacterium]MBU4554469.1 YedE-related selenium metabolism membrane protein [Bacillota bacterium]MBV1728017.1 YedE-related selenium metabolism membrane protein [Desulforudis sp.]MBV1735041.1 YedE-related selenium metabolism membrane protein [Desulforudis sp.]
MLKGKGLITVAGLTVGALAIILMVFGNPVNMGLCIACFLRDTAGGLGLHSADKLQYIRPEIPAIILGAFAAALVTRSYRSVGGSSTLTRFLLGFIGMIGLLVFLGCPLRMLLRMSAGDLNAWVGLVGLIAGIVAGIWFINRGFTLGRAVRQNAAHGYVLPGIFLVLLGLLLFNSTIFLYSSEGPASMRAPLLLSLGAGLVVGILAQRTRMCLIGPIRDLIMFRDPYLMFGMVGIFIAALIGNLVLGNFTVGFEGQPIAHSDGLWNFLGMALAGLSFTMIAGCPLRQMISASEGNTDSAVTIFGIILGGAAAHNFGLAASPAGVSPNGQIAVVAGLVVVLIIGFALSGARVLQQRRVTEGG